MILKVEKSSKGRKGFYKTKLETREQDIVPVYLNRKERIWLETLKAYFGTSKDSTALKRACFYNFLLDEELQRAKKKRGL